MRFDMQHVTVVLTQQQLFMIQLAPKYPSNPVLQIVQDMVMIVVYATIMKNLQYIPNLQIHII